MEGLVLQVRYLHPDLFAVRLEERFPDADDPVVYLEVLTEQEPVGSQKPDFHVCVFMGSAHDDVHLFTDGAGGIPLYQPPVCQVGRALVVGGVEVEPLFGFPAFAFGGEHVNPGGGSLQVRSDFALFLHEEVSGEHLFFNHGIYAPVYFFGRYEFGDGIAHFPLLALGKVFQ